MRGSEQTQASSRLGLDDQVLGTRFLIFPQAPHVSGYSTPETVWLSTPPHRMQPGPQDHRCYVRDPLFDKQPYEFPYLPPFVGDTWPPAEAAYDGHFDNVDIQSRQFLSAHAFACVSRVLDIWESYLAAPVVWHFADTFERLEIIPCVEWYNAQSGYGFLELGYERGEDGGFYPHALNFDIIAHEVGHTIMLASFGQPLDGVAAGDFAAFHEAGADLVSLLSFLHFDSGLDRLLRHCQGNLLVLNELNRIGELSGDQQVRIASNARRLSEVTDDVHDGSRPFTGAVFDTLVDSYHMRLVEEGLADERLLATSIRDLGDDAVRRISEATAVAFRASPFRFKSALVEARDDVALAMARIWPRLDPDDLTFAKAAEELAMAGEAIDPMLALKFEENFRWRDIW